MVSYKFRISTRRSKKYDAVFDDGRIVSFGAFKRDGTPYQQYKDSTPLRAFRAYDHNEDVNDTFNVTKSAIQCIALIGLARSIFGET
jgi:hypothetical protein